MPTFIILAVLFLIAAFSSGRQTAATATANNTAPAGNTAAKKDDPKHADPKPVEPAQPIHRRSDRWRLRPRRTRPRTSFARRKMCRA